MSHDRSKILDFKPITVHAMDLIWPYLAKEKGRTTDFSYGGILMWTNYFDYEYDIVDDTLFIKGKVENDISHTAFSIPVGSMPLKDSFGLLKEYCEIKSIPLIFSAVPEYAVEDLKILNPDGIEELYDWEDYLYEAGKLASLSGKHLNKKRNHVNKFMSSYPDWELKPLDSSTYNDAIHFMAEYEKEASDSEMAKLERLFSIDMINYIEDGNSQLEGSILYADSRPCALTISDIKGDTLFIHVEKALRDFPGSYEMINKAHAEKMIVLHPEISYINREDDAGDPGLRFAKESYHPVDKLKKYNIVFHSFPKGFERNQEIINFAMEAF